MKLQLLQLLQLLPEATPDTDAPLTPTLEAADAAAAPPDVDEPAFCAEQCAEAPPEAPAEEIGDFKSDDAPAPPVAPVEIEEDIVDAAPDEAPAPVAAPEAPVATPETEAPLLLQLAPAPGCSSSSCW